MDSEGYQREIHVRNDLFDFEGQLTVTESESLADELEDRLEHAFSEEVIADVLQDHLDETLIRFVFSQKSD